MSTKVEDFFITPLEAHFESQPTDGVRSTIIEDMEQYAPEDLDTAVEWLKRARQSQKTFPSPKECIKAIKAVVGGRSDKPGASYSTITAETYCAASIQFCAGMRELPVIKEGEPQWDEWHAYWEWLGMKWIPRLIANEQRKKWTVPTYFPSRFDRRFTFLKRVDRAA